MACFTIDNKLARALAALSCLSKIALDLTSSKVISFLFASDGWACFVWISIGVGLTTFSLIPFGKSPVG